MRPQSSIQTLDPARRAPNAGRLFNFGLAAIVGVTGAHRQNRSQHALRNLHSWIPVRTRPVAVHSPNPDSSVLSSASAPFVFPSPVIAPSQARPESRAAELLRALRKGEDTLVEVELGRYDDPTPDVFDRVPMRLGQYLDWLETSPSGDGKIDGRQVYLTQWRAGDEIDAVRDIIRPPPALGVLLASHRADLYQSSFFIGPIGSVTPLHYDPYMNLFHLQASSSPIQYVKHLTLIPPSASGFIKRSDDHGALRNTSPVNINLHRRSLSGGETEFDVGVDPSAPVKAAEAVSASAQTCALHEGETLFIPRGWWHRVENVALSDPPHRERVGWIAGIAWWFLSRSNS